MTRRSPSRQGAAIVLALAVLTVVGMVLVADLTGFGHRLRQSGQRQARIQAREYALGAAALPAGTTLALGPWTLAHVHDADGDHCSATGPTGTYRIDSAAAAVAAESWTRSAAPTATVKATP